jgi:predicted HTH domain antitoxin
MQALRLEPRDFVAAQLYETEDDVVQEALRHLLDDRPDLRIALATYRYRTDTSLTLATAAALAGISLERMKDELVARGIEPRLGPATVDEARAEFAALKRSLNARAD